jgi:uncharacterized protein (TIGR02145 family)
MKKTIAILMLFCVAAFAQSTFTDSRDGKKYKSVKIGTQTWMAENLNYNVKGSLCYENSSANCAIYGRLYDWNTAMKACPSGWHLPSNEEWDKLYRFADGTSDMGSPYQSATAGKLLKAKSGWDDYEGKSSNGTDAFGFSALPGGSTDVEGRSGGFSTAGYWWSASELNDAYRAYLRLIYHDNDSAFWGASNMGYNFYSVRCLQGTAEEAMAERVKEAEAEKAKLFNPKINYGSMTDARDKITYKTVKIGTQTWMAENLNYNVKGSLCYENNPANCAKYGRLYKWASVMGFAESCNTKTVANCATVAPKHKDVCPDGWHIPSKAEYDALSSYVESNKGCSDCDAKHLKAKSGWVRAGNGTDEYGFSALPGGYDGGNLAAAGYGGNWWSAREIDAYRAYRWFMAYGGENASWNNDSKSYLFSVRCLQGTAEEAMAELEKAAEAEKAKLFNPKINYGSVTDARDKITYKTVKIGTQTWMAENLNYNVKGSLCYENSSANCAIYGRLYDWNTAVKSCPAGWHLPSADEWDKLYRFAGGTSDTKSPYPSPTTGKLLKAKSGWVRAGNGTDEYGFSALPGGYGSSDGGFDNAGYCGLWWSASEDATSFAYNQYIYYNNEDADMYDYSRSFLISVRCLQDYKSVGNYKDGKPDGEWKRFGENGNLIQVENYKDGKPDGEWKGFYQDGKSEFISNFKNDKPDGEWKTFYQDGKLWSIRNYKDGERHGEQKTFDKNENLTKVENYKDGKRHGEQKTFDANGNLTKVENYKDGKQYGEQKTFDANGNLTKVENYKDDKQYGEQKTFDANGNLISVENIDGRINPPRAKIRR